MKREYWANKLCAAAEQVGLTVVLAQFGNGLRYRVPMTQRMWDTSIEELNLTVRSRNGLMRAGASTVGKVSELIMSENGLEKVRNLGKKSIAEIKTALLTEGYNQLTPAEKNEFWVQFLMNNDIN